MADRIMTLHPQGKAGVNSKQQKCDVMRATILDVIRQHGEITFKDLMAEVEKRLNGNFDGSVSWYTTTVKLDLEARGEIQGIPRSSPQRLRLTENSVSNFRVKGWSDRWWIMPDFCSEQPAPRKRL